MVLKTATQNKLSSVNVITRNGNYMKQIIERNIVEI